MTGEDPKALKRAEIVIVRTPGRGEVFSVGSIIFCSSIWNDTGFTEADWSEGAPA